MIGTGGAVDNGWLRQHQGPNQVAHQYRVFSAKLAMLQGDVYLPKVFNPTLFAQGNEQCTPQTLFPETRCTWSMFPGFSPYRFRLFSERPVGPRTPINMQLIFTDGACSNNGRHGARSAFGFALCSQGRENTRGCVCFPVEKQGPDGQPCKPTSNRAELRAVIAALEWRKWYREGWEAVVIATDSTYVADGATKWVSGWIAQEWWKSDGNKVLNKDLWMRLLQLFRQYAIHGCEIIMWRIPRWQNTLAHNAAARGLEKMTKIIEWKSHRDPMLDVDQDFDF